MHWGAQSRQYGRVQRGAVYYLIGESENGWQYVCRELKSMLTDGGWCPPDVFVATIGIEPAIGYEVTLPVLTAQTQEYVSENIEPPTTGTALEVYTDGSHQPLLDGEIGEGIAAGWIVGHNEATGRVSIRGRYTGAEVSELLGIICTLGHLWYKRKTDAVMQYNTIIIRIDSTNAIHHVFRDESPLDLEGAYLLPAISLAKYLVRKFHGVGVRICPRYIKSKLNSAHCIAKNEQSRRRRDDRWSAHFDVWPAIIPVVWRTVFDDVSSNQIAQQCIYDEIHPDVRDSVF